jgi:hypothetical protein
MLPSLLSFSLNFILLFIIFYFEFERDYNGPINYVKAEIKCMYQLQVAYAANRITFYN